MTEKSAGTMRLWLLGGFVVPAVILGVPYLTASYSDLEGTGVIWGWGLLVLMATAFVVRAAGRAPLLLTVAATTGALLALVIVRIVFDVAIDPTDHNLWPFEIIIAAVLGGTASAAGALLGSIPGWLQHRR